MICVTPEHPPTGASRVAFGSPAGDQPAEKLMPEITDNLPDACAILVREIETVDEANALRIMLPRLRLVMGLAAAASKNDAIELVELQTRRDHEEAIFHGEPDA